MPVAVITGASQGLGRALARALAERGGSGRWRRPRPGRPGRRLRRPSPAGHAPVVAGDVTEPGHRRDACRGSRRLGGADLLVNNASTLGASPLPAFADLDPETYRAVFETNVVAPLALVRELLPQLRAARGPVVDISSDAAVEAYETWGGYGSSKAALDHASRILAAEEPALRVYAVDPGDMRTADAPGRLPRRGHLRPPAARDRRTRAAAAAGRRPAGRAVPGGRRSAVTAAEVPRVTARPAFRFELPTAARRRRRPRPAAWPATRSGWPSPRRRRRRTPGPATSPDHLHPGDLLVVNTSATVARRRRLPPARLHQDAARLHRARRRPLGRRGPAARPVRPGACPTPARCSGCPAALRLRVVEPHPSGQRRLWRARPAAAASTPSTTSPSTAARSATATSTATGRSTDLQNVYADRPGQRRDAERRPAAHRAAAGAADVAAASRSRRSCCTPASPARSRTSHRSRSGSRCPAATARLVNATRAAGRRVVAVGTTVVRALESATAGGRVVPTSGWTSLVLGPDRPARVVDGLLTGLHEPEASHLHLLEAVAGRALVDAAYAEVTRPDGAAVPLARVRRHDAAAPR